jgi:LacI family transcriptional regulator
MRLKDIALKTGVSIKTVSRVIHNQPEVSDETRAKILKVVEEYPYLPNLVARGLKEKKTYSIGYVICQINNPFFIEVVLTVERIFKESGYGILISFTGPSIEDEINSLKLLISKRVDGLILASFGKTASFLKKIINDEKIPIVLIDNKVKGVKSDGVFLDNINGAHLLTKHLIEHGHKNIAFITGPTYESSSRERLQGYKKALYEHDIKVNKDLIKISNWEISGGFNSTIELMKIFSKNLSAIFLANTLMALGSLTALKKLNLKVPEDVALVSFDNLDISGVVDPPLTTLNKAADKVGKLAAELLNNKLQSHNAEYKNIRELIIKQELCIRKSCGCNK